MLYQLIRVIFRERDTENCLEERDDIDLYDSKTRNKLPRIRIELMKKLLKQTKGRAYIKGIVFRAAREGNFEFLSIALELYPDLAIQVDENDHTIFHVAVQCRHLDVFKMDSIRRFVKLKTDREGNNILHFAAKLLITGLDVVPGAALQLQRELQWFQEVKKVVGLEHMKTETEIWTRLFKEEHEELRRTGEKWLRNTTESCMLSATLITTLSLITGFSALSGIGQQKGRPILVENIWFETFATSNAITLVFAFSSVLFFLSILTSTFSMEEFLKSLPFKLLLGLFSLTASILVMMVGCFAALFGVSKDQELRFPYRVAVLAFIPVPFIAWLYVPLFYHVFQSMLLSFLQFKPQNSRIWEQV